MHPLPLSRDASSTDRDAFVQKPAHQHPSATYQQMRNILGHSNESYYNLCHECMRHRHSIGYCLAKGSCRFCFPRERNPLTRITIQELPYIKGDNKGKLRRTMLKIVPATNDGWLNGHCRVALDYWGGNVDFQLLLDTTAVMLYVAKYVAKSETVSSGLEKIHEAVLKRAYDMDDINPAKVLRKLFQKVAGGRDKSIQESCHLGLSLPLVHCSKRFVIINLLTKLCKVNIQADEGESVVQNKIQVIYPLCRVPYIRTPIHTIPSTR